MVTQIFTNLQNGGEGFVGFLKSMIESVISIFWTAPTGSATTGSFTDVGILMLVAVSIGVVYGVIRYLTRLVKLKG